MLKEKQKLRIYLVALAVVLLAVVVLIIWHGGRGKTSETPAAVTPRPTTQVIVRERPVEKNVQIETVKEFTTEEICSGLRDMGFLLTQEYYFTDAISYSSVKSIFSIELGITESSYVATYDGVITAGVDFSQIALRRDDDRHEIVVSMPAAEIQSVDIDPKSFVLHSEKTGLANPTSISDYNTSLVQLEESERQKALDRGLLEQAGENARRIVGSFIAGFVDTSEYKIRFEDAA